MGFEQLIQQNEIVIPLIDEIGPKARKNSLNRYGINLADKNSADLTCKAS